MQHYAPGPYCTGLTFCHALQVNAWLSHIKTENFAYPACTLQYNGKQCNKKVSDSGGGAGDMQWYCERCGSYCQAEWRYMLNLQLEDHTGKEWVTAFQVGLACCMLRLSGRKNVTDWIAAFQAGFTSAAEVAPAAAAALRAPLFLQPCRQPVIQGSFPA